MAGWDERMAQLEGEFPGWHTWRPNADRWGPPGPGAALRREDPSAGIFRFRHMFLYRS